MTPPLVILIGDIVPDLVGAGRVRVDRDAVRVAEGELHRVHVKSRGDLALLHERLLIGVESGEDVGARP